MMCELLGFTTYLLTNYLCFKKPTGEVKLVSTEEYRSDLESLGLKCIPIQSLPVFSVLQVEDRVSIPFND